MKVLKLSVQKPNCRTGNRLYPLFTWSSWL